MCALQAQQDSSIKINPETTKAVISKPKIDSVKKIISPKKDSVVKVIIDSAFIKDSIAKSIAFIDSLRNDSIAKANLALMELRKTDSTTYYSIMPQSYFPFNKSLFFMIEPERVPKSKDELFYLLAGILFLVGLIKIAFPKYFQNIFQLFFQPSFRQKQTRDQLLLGNLPSLLMNFLFIISASLYVALIESSNGINNISFWKILLISNLIFAIIYLGKYGFLVFTGWVFNMKEAASTYTFVVFLVNKMIAIILIPFILVQAFSASYITEVAVTIAFVIVITLLIYRYLISWITIKKDLQVNALHFFLYLCAVEILPVLLIWKALINYFGKSI